MNYYLVADDSKVGRMAMVAVIRALDPDGQVEQAQNGREAFETLERMTGAELPVRLVVTDLNMPVMDGKALLLKIRAEPMYNAIPVAIVSAESDAAVIQDTIRGAEPVAFLGKGLPREEFIQELKRFLEGEKVIRADAAASVAPGASRNATGIFVEAVAGAMARFLRSGFELGDLTRVGGVAPNVKPTALISAEYALDGKGLKGLGRVTLPVGFMSAFGRLYGAEFGLFGDEAQAARDLVQEISNVVFTRMRTEWNRAFGFGIAQTVPTLVQRVSNDFGGVVPKAVFSLPVEFVLGWLYVELLLEEFPDAQFTLASPPKIG